MATSGEPACPATPREVLVVERAARRGETGDALHAIALPAAGGG
jgi:hypothetical protein